MKRLSTWPGEVPRVIPFSVQFYDNSEGAKELDVIARPGQQALS